MAAPVILALDIATHTGWCVGPADDPSPAFGTLRLKMERGRGSVGAHFLRQLTALIKERTPSTLVIEEPLNIEALKKLQRATVNNIMLTHGLAFLAETIADALNVPKIQTVRVQDVRAHFVMRRTFKAVTIPGKTRKSTSREEAKRAVQAQCHRLGIHVTNDNEADAYALWHYAASRWKPAIAMQTTPLFGARA